MLRFFGKKAFGGCKSQIFVNGYRRSMRLGDDFDWLEAG